MALFSIKQRNQHLKLHSVFTSVIFVEYLNFFDDLSYVSVTSVQKVST